MIIIALMIVLLKTGRSHSEALSHASAAAPNVTCASGHPKPGHPQTQALEPSKRQSEHRCCFRRHLRRVQGAQPHLPHLRDSNHAVRG